MIPAPVCRVANLQAVLKAALALLYLGMENLREIFSKLLAASLSFSHAF